jgi:peroxiredoxin (alkyl hydroperoxide reductase subunit C)
MFDPQRVAGRSGGVRLEPADHRGTFSHTNSENSVNDQGVALGVGDEAPDFELPAVIGGVRKKFHLSQARIDQNVVLAFYAFNWQETRARQIIECQAEGARIRQLKAEVVGITVDSIMNITAWEREIGPIDFPLCSDFWPHGEVSQRYGVLRTSGENMGASERAIFVVDREGRIVFAEKYAPEAVPGIDDFLRVLQKL